MSLTGDTTETTPTTPRIDYIDEGSARADKARRIVDGGNANLRQGEVAVVNALLAVYYQLCELTDSADRNGRHLEAPLAKIAERTKVVSEIALDWEETEGIKRTDTPDAADERTGG